MFKRQRNHVFACPPKTQLTGRCPLRSTLDSRSGVFFFLFSLGGCGRPSFTIPYHPLPFLTIHYHPAACHFYYSTGKGIRSNSQKIIVNSSKSHTHTHTQACTHARLPFSKPSDHIRRMASGENYQCPCFKANWRFRFKHTRPLSTFETSNIATIPSMRCFAMNDECVW